jgi:DNA modification methylase
MKHVLRLSTADFRAEQLAAADDDDHFSEVLVRTVLEEYTAPGDRVLDPFAGFGTTLAVSEARAGRPEQHRYRRRRPQAGRPQP